MIAQRAQLAGLTLTLPEGWLDITDDLPEGSPPTLAKTNGIGALQFSVARHQSGRGPCIQEHDLKSLLQKFSETHNLGAATGVRANSQSEGTCSLVADFRSEDEAIRAWYVSNGSDLVFATYTTQLIRDEHLSSELLESSAIVASIVW
jgi:hypothetical protein